MAASYPGSVPDLATLVLSNPQSYAQFTRLIEELQAAFTTLGANPQAGSGTVDARLDTLEATLLVAANTGYRNLRVANNATTPATKLDVSADLLAVEGALLSTVAVTIDLTATGKNGMTATRAVSTWYYVWVGQHGTTGEVCAILDDASGRSLIDVSHASLIGFTRWRRVGAVRTNATSSGELPRTTQVGDWCSHIGYADFAALNSSANVWTTRALSTSVPPSSRRAVIAGVLNGTTNPSLYVSEVGVDADRLLTEQLYKVSETIVTLDASQQYRWKSTETSTAGVLFWTVGYWDAI